MRASIVSGSVSLPGTISNNFIAFTGLKKWVTAKFFFNLSGIPSEISFNNIPEVFDGLINVKKVVRVPGEKAKVAVDSYDDRIDPVGACVGMKGSRIHGIVRELCY